MTLNYLLSFLASPIPLNYFTLVWTLFFLQLHNIYAIQIGSLTKLFDCMRVEVKAVKRRSQGRHEGQRETRVQLDAQNTPKRGIGTFPSSRSTQKDRVETDRFSATHVPRPRGFINECSGIICTAMSTRGRCRHIVPCGNHLDAMK
ncbi:hypothetical protein DFH94DRAFT_467175 [Russula ochroleuca]|jgi:hypothetical protein|uniref:Uncharacterized protein n=1 Tax=Russula ochroleuca TaxID=152965 RepID=A0A9P5MW65_9AGAM|nr:hypothetical protein DFH94DRAFT_467175 [Russula ochroleuca]